MSIGRPLKPLTLKPEEHTKLERMARRPKTDQRTAQRARIVLDCAAGLSNSAVAAKRGVTLRWANGGNAFSKAGWELWGMPHVPASRAS